MLALYKEQSMLLSLQRQHRKLSSFISKWGLVSAAPCSLIKPDQLSTTPAEKGLKTVSFSNIQGNVKFLGRIWWTIQWATAAWMKSANKKTKEKDTKNKGKSFYHLTMKGVADVTQKHFHYRRNKKNQIISRGLSPLSWKQKYWKSHPLNWCHNHQMPTSSIKVTTTNILFSQPLQIGQDQDCRGSITLG